MPVMSRCDGILPAMSAHEPAARRRRSRCSMADRDGRRRGDRRDRARPAVAPAAPAAVPPSPASADVAPTVRRAAAARPAVAAASSRRRARSPNRRPRRRNRRALLAAGRRDDRGAGRAGRRVSTLCPLKRTATNTVFIDGNPAARDHDHRRGAGRRRRPHRPAVCRPRRPAARPHAGGDRPRPHAACRSPTSSTGARPATASRPPPRSPPACRSCCAISRWRGRKVLVLAGGTAASTLLPVSRRHHPAARPLVRACRPRPRRAGADPADVPPGLSAAHPGAQARSLARPPRLEGAA